MAVEFYTGYSTLRHTDNAFEPYNSRRQIEFNLASNKVPGNPISPVCPKP